MKIFAMEKNGFGQWIVDAEIVDELGSRHGVRLLGDETSGRWRVDMYGYHRANKGSIELNDEQKRVLREAHGKYMKRVGAKK